MENQRRNFFGRIASLISKHKVRIAVILIVIASAGYYIYSATRSATTAAQYVFGQVTRGDLVVSVSGSGQVATVDEVAIKPQTVGQTQTLGQIIQVDVKNGDTVKAGQVVAVLDGKQALQALNQAEASVESAQASYDKLVNGPTAQQLQPLKNSIQSSTLNLENDSQNILIDLQNAYTSAYDNVYLNTDPFFVNTFSANPSLSISGVTYTNQLLQNSVNSERITVATVLQNWKQELSGATAQAISRPCSTTGWQI